MRAAFDGDNTYPDCKRCGKCCEINVLCMTSEEFHIIEDAVLAGEVAPIDYGQARCCFQSEDRTCMFWDKRPQVCRLHNCKIPRVDILRIDPSIKVSEDLWMVDLHESFVNLGNAD